MIQYKYRCKKCKYEFYRNYPSIENVSEIDRTAPIKCSICGSKECEKVFEPVPAIFKGAGFYRTDHRKD